MARKKIETAPKNDHIGAEANGKELNLMISALGANTLCHMQNCTTANCARENVHLRYNHKTIINKLGVLNRLLIFQLRG